MMELIACPQCGHVKDDLHWNPPSTLALVDSDILIRVPAGTREHDEEDELTGIYLSDTVLHARRTHYLRDKQGDMKYRLINGNYLTGKFHWTHP